MACGKPVQGLRFDTSTEAREKCGLSTILFT